MEGLSITRIFWGYVIVLFLACRSSYELRCSFLLEKCAKSDLVPHRHHFLVQLSCRQAVAKQIEAVHQKQKSKLQRHAYATVVSATVSFILELITASHQPAHPQAYDLRTASTAIQSGCRVLIALRSQENSAAAKKDQQMDIIASMTAANEFSTLFLDQMAVSAALLTGSDIPISEEPVVIRGACFEVLCQQLGKLTCVSLQNISRRQFHVPSLLGACLSSCFSRTKKVMQCSFGSGSSGRVEHTIEVDPRVPHTILTDPLCLSRNFLNLLRCDTQPVFLARYSPSCCVQ